MPHVAVKGARLAFHEWPGRGPTLLCIHGITANCHAWDLWAEQLAPAGLLTDSDCIMFREEGERLASAIPRARLVTVAGANHYTILLAPNAEALSEVNQFLAGEPP